MVRTKANVNTSSVRVAAAKAPRKNVGGVGYSSFVTSPSGRKEKVVGGNPICPRATPEWQKPIGTFFSIVTKRNDETPQQEKEVSSGQVHSHDDKENRNPDVISEISKGEEVINTEEEAGPSTSRSSEPYVKRRRILQFDESESETESEEAKEKEKVKGCVAMVEDEIMTC